MPSSTSSCHSCGVNNTGRQILNVYNKFLKAFVNGAKSFPHFPFSSENIDACEPGRPTTYLVRVDPSAAAEWFEFLSEISIIYRRIYIYIYDDLLKAVVSFSCLFSRGFAHFQRSNSQQ